MTRRFLLFEAATFAVAALIHFGVLLNGYAHQKAAIAESVIGTVLLAGAVAMSMRPERERIAGIAAQGFALLGTLVGVLTIAIGIGPRSLPDLVYHAAIIVVLIWGLTITARAPAYGASVRS